MCLPNKCIHIYRKIMVTINTHHPFTTKNPLTKPYGSFSVFLRTPDSEILILPTGQLQSDADWSGKTGWLFASTRWVLDPVINGVSSVLQMAENKWVCLGLFHPTYRFYFKQECSISNVKIWSKGLFYFLEVLNSIGLLKIPMMSFSGECFCNW